MTKSPLSLRSAPAAAALFTCLLSAAARVSPAAAASSEVETNSFGQPLYGLDVSFPIQHATVQPLSSGNPVGDRQRFYDDFMDGCRSHSGNRGAACDNVEKGRISQALSQPVQMQNYTEMGFKKIRAPEAVFRLIKDFWERNKDKGKPEKWSIGNTYTNNWEAPTDFVSVEDTTLRGGGALLKARLWDAAKETLQEWTGEELTPCSLYGIRVYTEGAILNTHVDRMPLVSSAIINVAQDLDEPWPIEVYAHDGNAYNVTMEPGDMVLYESHSILHGRPFPLKGRMYANVFIHFEPVGHSLRHGHDASDVHLDVKAQYRNAAKKGHGGHENMAHPAIPPYVVEGTEEADKFRQSHRQGWQPTDASGFSTGTSWAHKAAIAGDIETLREIAEQNRDALDLQDENGWKPLHEAVRAGHKDVVEFLVKNGANPNERAGKRKDLGMTPLRLARQSGMDDSDPVVEFLMGLGALDAGPEL